MWYKLKRIMMRPNGVEKQVRPPRQFNWDLSKAIASNRTSFTVSAYSYEVKLSADGTKMFIGWNNPNHPGSPDGAIVQYTLTTPFDITTATDRIDYGVWILRDYPNPCFADNWMKLFVWKGNNTTYARYDLTTAYDLSTVDFSNPDATFSMTSDLAIQSVSADGKSFIYRPWSSRNLSYAVSSTAREPLNSQTNLISSSNVVSWTFCNEWKMLMFMDGTTIKKYEFWTPYDLTTLNTTPIQTQSTGLSWNPWGIYVDIYWDNIYFAIGNTTVYRYNLV